MNTSASSNSKTSSRLAPVILLFSNDLRLYDNPSLCAAAQSGAPIVPCFVLPSSRTGSEAPGGASRWWLMQSLAALDADLRQRGGQLVVLEGDTGSELVRLAARLGAKRVYRSRSYLPGAAGESDRLERVLHGAGIELMQSNGYLLFEPGSVKTGSGTSYRVFTPFWKACLAQARPELPRDIPAHLVFHAGAAGAGESDLSFRLPSPPAWSRGLQDAWKPGESGAWLRVENFIESALGGYDSLRDVPGRNGTSRLSPHLHFGEVSPRAVWSAIEQADLAGFETGGAAAFRRELGWREFCYQLLHDYPDMASVPLRPEYDRFPWLNEPQSLDRWQRGQTGIPLVDAGMRELWCTGWMHNRVRMIAASFLIKNLMVDWREGECWFRDTLVDADPANNAAGWQWVAGCGADAAPFFRVFNPVTQAKKFDAEGHYIRRWVPELERLPDRYLGAPWEAPDAVLRQAGVKIGESYPEPVVDLKMSRERVLSAWRSMNRENEKAVAAG